MVRGSRKSLNTSGWITGLYEVRTEFPPNSIHILAQSAACSPSNYVTHSQNGLDLRFLQRGLQSGLSSGIWKSVAWLFADVSEERTASLYRIEVYGRKVTSQTWKESRNGGSALLRNVGYLLSEYTASHPRRGNLSIISLIMTTGWRAFGALTSWPKWDVTEEVVDKMDGDS